MTKLSLTKHRENAVHEGFNLQGVEKKPRADPSGKGDASRIQAPLRHRRPRWPPLPNFIDSILPLPGRQGHGSREGDP